ncbi:MAG: hypothetical protein V7603_3226 [Micromonosporaceae bacterium]
MSAQHDVRSIRRAVPPEPAHRGPGRVPHPVVAHSSGTAPAGSVVLEVGEDTGVLIIHGSAAEHLREIEISPAGDPDAPRTHVAVRPRALPDGTVHAAVYAGLAPAHYTVWRDRSTPHGSVRVTAGRISEYDWRP